MEMTSLLDIVGGRLEALPRIKERVDLSKSLQNSSGKTENIANFIEVNHLEMYLDI